MYKTKKDIDQEIERLETLEERYIDSGADNAAVRVSLEIRQLERQRDKLPD